MNQLSVVMVLLNFAFGKITQKGRMVSGKLDRETLRNSLIYVK